MDGNFESFSFSGCGEINPLQNDPSGNTIKKTSKVLLNGSEGIVLGNGTRSSDIKPNLMLAADMHQMNSTYVGGFKTAEGPEVFDSVAIPVPVLDENVFNSLMVLNKEISLPIADIQGRHLPLFETDYETVWNDHDERPKFHEEKCINCSDCLVEERCPTFAYVNKKGNKNLDLVKCFGCGMCAYSCLGNAFEMNTGSVPVEIDGNNHNIPIACRQSDIKRAKSLASKLKIMIKNNEFKL
jgi:putative methanogenesis marker 16 metalloprotein